MNEGWAGAARGAQSRAERGALRGAGPAGAAGGRPAGREGRPRRLGVRSRPGPGKRSGPARPGRSARTRAVRGRRGRLLPPGPREPAAPGESGAPEPETGGRGDGSGPGAGVRAGLAPPAGSLPVPDAAPPDSGAGVSVPPARRHPSSAAWYAPGDRCLGIAHIWDAANAEVKGNTSGEGGPGAGSGGRAGGLDARVLRRRVLTGARGRAPPLLRGTGKGETGAPPGEGPLNPPPSRPQRRGPHGRRGFSPCAGGGSRFLPTRASPAPPPSSGAPPRPGAPGPVPGSLESRQTKGAESPPPGCRGRGGGGERVDGQRGFSEKPGSGSRARGSGRRGGPRAPPPRRLEANPSPGGKGGAGRRNAGAGATAPPPPRPAGSAAPRADPGLLIHAREWGAPWPRRTSVSAPGGTGGPDRTPGAHGQGVWAGFLLRWGGGSLQGRSAVRAPMGRRGRGVPSPC